MALTRIYSIITLVIILVSTNVIYAQAKSNEGVFKFEKEWYDFGKIDKEVKVSYDFKFTNILAKWYLALSLVSSSSSTFLKVSIARSLLPVS